MSKKQDKEIKKDKSKYYKKVPFWIPWLMLAVLVCICIFISTWVKTTIKEYVTYDRFVRHSMGSKIYYNADLVLKREDGVTYLDTDCTLKSDGSPLVYEGQHKYLLPVSMAYLNPNSEGGPKRVNYFSKTLCNMDKKKVTVSYNDKDTEIKDGFMYDGNGTFIFVEEVEIKVGKMKYSLSPMSYVRVFYKDSIEIYNLKENEYTYIELEKGNEVIAEAKTGYSINLGTNVMTVKDAPRILFSNIEAMGVLE